MEKKFIIGIKNLAERILDRIESGEEFCSLVVELCKDVRGAPMVTVDDVEEALEREADKMIKEGGCFDFGSVIEELIKKYEKPVIQYTVQPLSSRIASSGAKINCEKHGLQAVHMTKNMTGYCMQCWNDKMVMSASMAPAGKIDKEGNFILESVNLVASKDKK